MSSSCIFSRGGQPLAVSTLRYGGIQQQLCHQIPALRKSGAIKISLSEYADARHKRYAQRISRGSLITQQIENMRDFVSTGGQMTLYTMARALLGLFWDYSRSGRGHHGEL
jgi:hypothetical protein